MGENEEPSCPLVQHADKSVQTSATVSPEAPTSIASPAAGFKIAAPAPSNAHVSKCDDSKGVGSTSAKKGQGNQTTSPEIERFVREVGGGRPGKQDLMAYVVRAQECWVRWRRERQEASKTRLEQAKSTGSLGGAPLAV